MVSYQSSEQSAAASERRTIQRYQIDCPGSLAMPGGERFGRLTDLSQKGARFRTAEPVAQGTSGLLRWMDQEHFCRVVWARDGACGVVFDYPIGLEIVARSGELVEIEAGPVARFGSIPIAARGRRASLGISDETTQGGDNQDGDRKVAAIMGRLARLRRV